ncbi:hypothetical protein ALTERO38_20047 [Alteromonas sp. 38]|nr:hypothetical protein ALTER154_100491 [Alteromonas sp. 154]VXA94929.1 hypothetical protein ALTERO38_20047 [Alteromonas sp. 38]
MLAQFYLADVAKQCSPDLDSFITKLFQYAPLITVIIAVKPFSNSIDQPE